MLQTFNSIVVYCIIIDQIFMCGPKNNIHDTNTMRSLFGAGSSQEVSSNVLHVIPFLLTDHQQGTHALDHHAIVLRVGSDRLREMTGVPVVDVAGKPGMHDTRILVKMKKAFLNGGYVPNPVQIKRRD